jgi:hypothetical protein
MSNKLVIGVAAGFVVAAGITAAKRRSSGPSPDRWAKMRQRMEQMPEDFPPRVMFDNVEATRANTEEILSLLKQGPPSEAAPTP